MYIFNSYEISLFFSIQILFENNLLSVSVENMQTSQTFVEICMNVINVLFQSAVQDP